MARTIKSGIAGNNAQTVGFGLFSEAGFIHRIAIVSGTDRAYAIRAEI